MNTAVRWIGAGSLAAVASALLATSLRDRAVAAEPDPAEMELGRCTDAEVGERLELQREFDKCVANHAGDILARRHQGDRLVIRASMDTGFSACAHDVACTFARAPVDPKARFHRWQLRPDARFEWGGTLVRFCAILDVGGVRAALDDAHGQATVETEVGTYIDRCIGSGGAPFVLFDEDELRRRIAERVRSCPGMAAR